MISLCVYDMIYLIASLIMFSWPLLFPQFILDLSFATSITYLLPVAQIAMTGERGKKKLGLKESIVINVEVLSTQ